MFTYNFHVVLVLYSAGHWAAKYRDRHVDKHRFIDHQPIGTRPLQVRENA